MIGRTLSHYRITAKMGAGGMGEVYRATDSKLGREVALKVLPPAMANDAERLSRFQREARAVAALNHPHIVTIFSVEEAEGIHFLTMELVEGISLDRGIPPGGLPVEKIVEIAGALADALSAAHEKGIIHRDLKPGNVMLTTDGRVKVLDFGLAKDTRAESSTDDTMTSAQTQVGVIMGTPAYMSPEQIAGRALDHRTDIFSLGVMLHEMATGKRPFEGDSSAELHSAILRDHPPAVTDFRGDLPIDLARIIRRCLEKDPRYRVQTARDVSNEFRDLARQAVPADVMASGSMRLGAKTSGTFRAGAREDESFWIAVLPFKYAGASADLKALAEGLTEEIITGLSRFSYLRVIAHGSTAKYSSESGDVRAIGKELGARYVMEASLRHAGTKLRLAVQLVDATNGSHVWAETYERTFNSETAFELQDELVPRIVATIADAHGILPHTLGESVRSKNPEQLTPYEAIWRAFSYAERVAPEEHAVVRSALERAVELAPNFAYAWAMLSLTIKDEYESGFNPKPDPLERMLQAARRAIELDPSGHRGYHALAMTHFYRKEIQPFRVAADRALALNPMDGCNVGHLGSYIAYAGEWDRGCGLVERAAQLNPNHPGWFWFPLAFNAYRKHDYQGALAYALKINLPNLLWTHSTLAAIYGQLGMHAEAAGEVKELLGLNPHFAHIARPGSRQIFEPELVEHIIEGLRKAGLEIPEDPAKNTSRSAAAASSTTGSGATYAAAREDEGFWVAVLPFKAAGASAELNSLADGLSEEIVTGLSRFSYLRVIARGSTLRYANQAVDLRFVGKELGARYVMEGTLRQAGAKLRVAVQLVDTSTGTHLWAHTYERAFAAEEIFALQDDLVPRIVSTVADQYGVLPRSMAEALRSKNEDLLTAHEAVLRTFTYFERLTPDEHAVVRRILEHAVKIAPENADCWSMLSMAYRGEFAQGFNTQPNSLERSLAAAHRAVELAPTNHLAYYALATTHFFMKEKQAFVVEADRCLALNPMDGSTMAYIGLLMSASIDAERGAALVRSAMELNPNHPGWYELAIFSSSYWKRDYQQALDAALKVRLPGYFHAHSARAAAYGQLGQKEAAQKSIQELLALRPDFASFARYEYSKWYEPDQIEHLIEGLRKAGLEIA